MSKNCILLYRLTNNHKLSFIVFLKDFFRWVTMLLILTTFILVTKKHFFWLRESNFENRWIKKDIQILFEIQGFYFACFAFSYLSILCISLEKSKVETNRNLSGGNSTVYGSLIKSAFKPFIVQNFSLV